MVPGGRCARPAPRSEHPVSRASGVRTPVAFETLKQSDTLLKGAHKWAMMAEQDQNLIMALMHINYAKAYVTAPGASRTIRSSGAPRDGHGRVGIEMDEVSEYSDQNFGGVSGLDARGEFAVRTGPLG